MKEARSEKISFDKINSCENLDNFFPNRAFVYPLMVPSCADQLLPQILIEQVDTFPIQCRHIEHMHEGVWFRKKIIFDKNTAVRT